jgi:hypothetical protein
MRLADIPRTIPTSMAIVTATAKNVTKSFEKSAGILSKYDINPNERMKRNSINMNIPSLFEREEALLTINPLPY